MIRAVFDANVLASGVTGFLILQSIPGRLLHAWRAAAFRLIASEHILVTGDRRLRERVPSYQGVTLVSPRGFLEILEQQGPASRRSVTE